MRSGLPSGLERGDQRSGNALARLMTLKVALLKILTQDIGHADGIYAFIWIISGASIYTRIIRRWIKLKVQTLHRSRINLPTNSEASRTSDGVKRGYLINPFVDDLVSTKDCSSLQGSPQAPIALGAAAAPGRPPWVWQFGID